MLENSEEMACDVLLDQDISAGVSNIIKNEVLYRIKVHPASLVGNMSLVRQKKMIKEARNYSFDFLEWKKAFVLPNTGLSIRKKKPRRPWKA